MTTLEQAGVPGGRGERMLKQLRFLYAPFGELVAREGRVQPLVVDLGTGSGLVLERIRERVPAARLIGLDIRSEPMRLGARGLAFVRSDAAHLPFATESVDVIVSRSSFAYCDDQQTVLAEVVRVLKPGGSAYIMDSTPGRLRRWLVILLGMVLLRRDYADMSGFSDRAISHPHLVAMLKRLGIGNYRYSRMFLGTYFMLTIRKAAATSARNGARCEHPQPAIALAPQV